MKAKWGRCWELPGRRYALSDPYGFIELAPLSLLVWRNRHGERVNVHPHEFSRARLVVRSVLCIRARRVRAKRADEQQHRRELAQIGAAS